MIPLPPTTRIYLACGATDMRKGFDGLAVLVQQVLWRHRIEIEEITPANPGMDYPRFVDGERRAPPEDVGGTPGFEEFLKAMAKPRHPERASMVQWYGGVFDPTDISIDEINARMAKLAKRRAQRKAAYADAKSRDS